MKRQRRDSRGRYVKSGSRRRRRNKLSGSFSKKGRAAARRYKSQVRKARLTILRRAKAGGWDGYGKIRRFRTGRPGVHEYVRPQAWMKSNPRRRRR